MRNIFNKALFLTFSLMMIGSWVFGQNTSFDKANFPGKEAQFKEALKNLKTGDKFYKASTPNYRQALNYFKAVNKFNPNNAELNFKLGDCYFHAKDYKKATEHLEKAKELDPRVDFRLNYILAKCYHMDYKFDEAIELLIKFRQTLDPKTISEYEKKIDKEINECKTGKKLVAEMLAHEDDMNLIGLIPEYKKKKILLIAGEYDKTSEPQYHYYPFVKAFNEYPFSSNLESVLLKDNHSFANTRIALSKTILDWLKKIEKDF